MASFQLAQLHGEREPTIEYIPPLQLPSPHYAYDIYLTTGQKCLPVDTLIRTIIMVPINSLSSLVRKLPSAEGPSPTEVAANIE